MTAVTKPLGRGRSAIGALVIAFMGASAAYNANVGGLRDRFDPPAQRLPTPVTAAPAAGAHSGGAGGAGTPGPASFDRRSHPWWQELGRFEGQGASTTGSFTIAAGALQWRVTWTCAAGTLKVTPVSSGGTSRRALADTRSCPADGQGFATQAGAHTLSVESTGPWTLVVEQQVDVPLVEPLTPAMAAAETRVTAAGSFYGIDREGRGSVRIFRLPDGSRMLRLDDFFVSINSDLEIWLSELPEPRSTSAAAAAGHHQVAFLKATTGAMNYAIDPSVDLSRYRSVVIWCEITHNAYSAAALAPGGWGRYFAGSERAKARPRSSQARRSSSSANPSVPT